MKSLGYDPGLAFAPASMSAVSGLQNYLPPMAPVGMG